MVAHLITEIIDQQSPLVLLVTEVLVSETVSKASEKRRMPPKEDMPTWGIPADTSREACF